jgi:hypothetical protein
MSSSQSCANKSEKFSARFTAQLSGEHGCVQLQALIVHFIMIAQMLSKLVPSNACTPAHAHLSTEHTQSD